MGRIGRTSLVASCLAAGFFAAAAHAEPLTHALTVANTDWTQAGVAGIGGAFSGTGTGTISLSGVSGAVTSAFLYWDGIYVDPSFSTPGVYSDSTITINGNAVTGTAIGDGPSRGWGPGTSRVYRANVTSFVASNGSYTLANMADCANCDVNGASLVVTFDDGNSANNRDVYIFNGNDSNYTESFPGETDGWHATMPGIVYGGGAATLSIHMGDGQDAPDASNLVIGATPNVGGTNPMTIADTPTLYDGNSLPSAGNSRLVLFGGVGDLFDIHTFDVTGLFNATPGTYALSVDGLDGAGDVLGLDVIIIDVLAVAQVVTPAPEPATLATLGLGLAGLGFARRRRR